MKVALVHDWLTGMRGAEKCLESFCRFFPEAPIYTLLHIPGSVSGGIEGHEIRTSFLQHLSFARAKYRDLLPLFPKAVEAFDLRDFDLVLSSSHCVAKGVRTRPETLHVCYCHTPMRYIWDMYEAYFGRGERVGVKGKLLSPVTAYLRRWDVATAGGVDIFVANSENVRDRIRRHYGREAEVIYPPVDVQGHRISEEIEGYFLVVSALVPYKRVDLAVEAFNHLGLSLVVVGEGSERRRLERAARPNVSFIGWQEDQKLKELYAKARALVFPGVEDLGIVPLEAQSSGRPVIAYRGGGALETVVEGVTGLFFRPQTPEALAEAVDSFDPCSFDPQTIRSHALRFDRRLFEDRMKVLIEREWKRWANG